MVVSLLGMVLDTLIHDLSLQDWEGADKSPRVSALFCTDSDFDLWTGKKVICSLHGYATIFL